MSMCLIFKILQRTVTDFNMPFWKKWIVAHFEADNEYVSIKSDSRKLKINPKGGTAKIEAQFGTEWFHGKVVCEADSKKGAEKLRATLEKVRSGNYKQGEDANNPIPGSSATSTKGMDPHQMVDCEFLNKSCHSMTFGKTSGLQYPMAGPWHA